MLDVWLFIRFKIGSWMLRKSMDVMPRCELRDHLRIAIVSVYGIHHNESE